jgi:hypothetical protein
MLRDALLFLINLGEVIFSVASILVAGLIIAKLAFWAVSRSLSKLSTPPAYEDEAEDYIPIPSPPGDTSIPTEDGGERYL